MHRFLFSYSSAYVDCLVTSSTAFGSKVSSESPFCGLFTASRTSSPIPTRGPVKFLRPSTNHWTVLIIIMIVKATMQ